MSRPPPLALPSSPHPRHRRRARSESRHASQTSLVDAPCRRATADGSRRGLAAGEKAPKASRRPATSAPSSRAAAWLPRPLGVDPGSAHDHQRLARHAVARNTLTLPVLWSVSLTLALAFPLFRPLASAFPPQARTTPSPVRPRSPSSNLLPPCIPSSPACPLRPHATRAGALALYPTSSPPRPHPPLARRAATVAPQKLTRSRSLYRDYPALSRTPSNGHGHAHAQPAATPSRSACRSRQSTR